MVASDVNLDAVLFALALADSPEMKAALAEYAHDILRRRSLGLEGAGVCWSILLTRRISRASWTERR